jgi:hypothetical protein
MFTAEMEAKPVVDDDVPYSDSVYPQELIDEWDRESDLIELEIENGAEIKSIDEQFAEHGF